MPEPATGFYQLHQRLCLALPLPDFELLVLLCSEFSTAPSNTLRPVASSTVHRALAWLPREHAGMRICHFEDSGYVPTVPTTRPPLQSSVASMR